MLLVYCCQDTVVACLQVLLERLTQAPETAVDAVSLLSAVERQTVLHTFNQTPICVPSGACQGQTIHGMLEYWAATTPAAPAALFQVRACARCCRACIRVGAAVHCA
jgi:non-ribosomal peptide synthetase component F